MPLKMIDQFSKYIFETFFCGLSSHFVKMKMLRNNTCILCLNSNESVNDNSTFNINTLLVFNIFFDKSSNR